MALTETRHAGEFIMSEGPGHYSRENITIKSGEGALVAGTVLGKTDGTVTVGDPAFTGTGNGTLTKATPAYGAGVQAGTYIVRLSEIATDSGQFIVIRPDGTVDGVAVVGTAYDGQVKFTIADGSTDFSGAAQFTLAVTKTDFEWRSADPTNTDGSAVAAGILLDAVDATSAAVDAVAIVRLAEVNDNLVTYDAGVDDAAKKATKRAELLAVGIVVRT